MTSPRSWLSPLTAAALALAVLITGATPLAGQYFGRNKVNYRTFDFRTLKTEHFDIYYYPEEEQAVRDAARMAERWYARLSRLLDHRFEERQPIVLYATHPHFQQTGVVGSTISEGTGGITEAFQQRVVMPFSYSYEETDHVLGHELVHAFQYDISGLGRAQGGLEAAARRFQVPLWFVEGMAEYLSVGPVDPHTAMWVRDAALTGQIPSIERLTYDPRVFPYRWGHALWAYVGGRYGDAVIGQILKQVGQGVPYEEAFERILNTTLEEIGEDWHASIRRAYLPLLAERKEAREIARPLITHRTEGGRLNIAPSISPDGRWVAFLSELDFMDVELHLANAETGEVIRTLQKGTAFDPHFGSLRYINSAGTWSPDGRQFAFSALRGGTDVLVILDVNRARRVREYRAPGVGEITNPSWSPDGSTIIFSGQKGGVTDLYTLDLRTGRTRQLTNDWYADLQPSYSPDGRTVAFVTDRGGDADITELEFGSYQIALMDVATGAIRALPEMTGSKNINPVWTGDGQGIFFVSNRTGIPNVYRLQVASGALTRVTDLFAGVSGITDMSPAITAARGTDRLLFTAFEKNGYNIYSLSEPGELAGTPAPAPQLAASGVPVPAILPPVPRPPEPPFNRVSAQLADDRTGLPRTDTFPVAPYRPRLILNYLGQPQVGVSTGGAFGRGGVQGGVAAIFSDVLGYHTLFGAIQAQGQLDEIGFSTVYLYKKHRWNYGASAQRIPFVYGYVRQGMDREDPTIFHRQLIRARIFNSSLQGVAQYPFSTVQRAELSGGVRRVAQDFQIIDQALKIDPGTGTIIGSLEPEIRNEEGESFNFAEASAALVYDNALVGYTSPFAGQRYRFELSPTVGQINFTQALADYRRYFFLRPFTLAGRGLHFGRYGIESEVDARGNPLFGDLYLGQPSLMRGYYDVYGRCSENAPGNDCEVLSQMLGSRVAVANAELRFPLIRQLVVGTGIGIPPIEGIAFFDAGVAWDSNINPVFRRFDRTMLANPGERGILTSAGVGGRINLFGYLVLEIDYVNGFQRDRGWHWQFAAQPGF